LVGARAHANQPGEGGAGRSRSMRAATDRCSRMRTKRERDLSPDAEHDVRVADAHRAQHMRCKIPRTPRCCVPCRVRVRTGRASFD
jgi:hypothetical protein